MCISVCQGRQRMAFMLVLGFLGASSSLQLGNVIGVWIVPMSLSDFSSPFPSFYILVLRSLQISMDFVFFCLFQYRGSLVKLILNFYFIIKINPYPFWTKDNATLMLWIHVNLMLNDGDHVLISWFDCVLWFYIIQLPAPFFFKHSLFWYE